MIKTKINASDTIYSLELGTCTDRAVRHFLKINNLPNLKVVYLSTFEECLKKVKEDVGSIIILPHIHFLSDKLNNDKEWLALKDNVFTLDNPPLYLVKGQLNDSTCAMLPTLRELLDTEDFKFVDANNTQDAAKQVSETKVSYGVTNETGQQKYNLRIMKELKKITMTWTPFRYIGKQ